METDRGAVLTIRAVARGVLDCSKADTRDLGWWRRSGLITRAIEADDERLVMQAAYSYHLALLGYAKLSDEGLKLCREAAFDVFRDLVNAVEPWTKSKNNTQSVTDELIANYKEVFGDPNDPDFIRKVEEGVALCRSLRKNRIKDETDEERVDRLLRERDEARRGLK